MFISHESPPQQQQPAPAAWFFAQSFIFVLHESPLQQQLAPAAWLFAPSFIFVLHESPLQQLSCFEECYFASFSEAESRLQHAIAQHDSVVFF
jgi:hypothetical protein